MVDMPKQSSKILLTQHRQRVEKQEHSDLSSLLKTNGLLSATELKLGDNPVGHLQLPIKESARASQESLKQTHIKQSIVTTKSNSISLSKRETKDYVIKGARKMLS